MRHLLSAWLTAGLATATLLSSATSFAQPEVRDHRTPYRPTGNTGPRDAPPPLRVEAHEAVRAGFFWQDGHWDWSNGSWQWTAGHWERVRAGKKWRPHRWEKRGDVFIRIEGDYIDAEIYPSAAPPARLAERVQARPGYVWIGGQWEWRDGQWAWVAGRLEAERVGSRWREARWESRNGRWELVAGGWEVNPVSPYPTSAPPPLRAENPAARPGFVFVRGRWEWRNGAWAWLDGRWEPTRAKQRWTEGRWENRGGRWEFVAGGWQACPDFPDQAPPPVRIENNAPRPDRVWLPGRWQWKDCEYQWLPGALSRPNPGHHYVAGQWLLRDGHYVWTNGEWIADAAPPPPPPPPVYTRPAPPPPRDETYSPRSGFIWAKGHWEWRTDKYEWIAGHWERQRAAMRWEDAHWEQRGSEWVFVEGGWR
jgi:YXWGXW repeat-containing protein